MKEDYVNSFLAPSKMVWEKEMGANLEVVGAEVTSNQFTTDDLTVTIGVSGRLEGNVLYGFSEDSAQSIVGVMLGKPISTVNDKLALSAIGEIGNMITGNAAALLAELGYTCNISPPVIINPAGSRFTTVVPQILVKFTSSVGGLAVRIGLTENSRPD